MPDTDHDEQELNGETGKGLRQQLEAALKQNAELTALVRDSKVNELLQGGKYTLVSASDLKDVPLDQIEAKAEELHKQHLAIGQEAMKAQLALRGLPAAEVESIIADVFSADAEARQQKGVYDRLKQVGSTTGAPPARAAEEVEPGYDRIRSALGAKKK